MSSDASNLKNTIEITSDYRGDEIVMQFGDTASANRINSVKNWK